MLSSIFFGEGEFKTFNIKDQQIGISTRLNYEIKENVISFLAYTYSQIDSNIDTRSYDRNLVELGVRVVF